MEPKFLICECGLKDHMLVLSRCDDDGFPELTVSVHLSTWKPWYRRLINAVRYVFGYRCAYGDFDEFCFNEESALQFVEALDDFYHKRTRYNIENKVL